ncbi:MAG: c-type cytochrome, partial [Caldimonas sp.]
MLGVVVRHVDRGGHAAPDGVRVAHPHRRNLARHRAAARDRAPAAPVASAAAASASAAAVATGPYKFDAAHGASLHATNCAACHQAGGTGLPGVFPLLKGNAAVFDADPATQFDTILNGAQGVPIGGVTYPSAMPPF